MVTQPKGGVPPLFFLEIKRSHASETQKESDIWDIPVKLIFIFPF